MISAASASASIASTFGLRRGEIRVLQQNSLKNDLDKSDRCSRRYVESDGSGVR